VSEQLSNASREICEQNTHADFTVNLAHPIDLGSTSNLNSRSVKFRVHRLPKRQARPTLLYRDISAIPGRQHRTLHTDVSALP